MSANEFWEQIQFFKPWEWKDDPDMADHKLIQVMDRVRHQAMIQVHIHGCWSQAGHSENSYHYTGRAVDFHFAPGLSPVREFIILAGQPELGGIGHYPGWYPRPGWHVDLRFWQDGRLYWSRIDGIYQYGSKSLTLSLGR